MADDQAKDFFKDQYFTSLREDIADIKETQKEQAKDIADIKSKVIYMYGFAAAVGIFASIFIDWFRTSVFGISH
jgi:hypothetical protein